MLDEIDEEVEGFRREGYDGAGAQEQPLRWIEPERAELVDRIAKRRARQMPPLQARSHRFLTIPGRPVL